MQAGGQQLLWFWYLHYYDEDVKSVNIYRNILRVNYMKLSVELQIQL